MLLGIYAACALMFALLHYRDNLLYQQHQGSTVRMYALLLSVAGFSGERPFQYRILIPALAHLMQAVLHVPILVGYQLLETVFLFLLFLAFRRYLAAFMPDRICRFATLALLYPLLWNYVLLGHVYWPYDIPGIFFFVAGLVCLLEGRWNVYYPLFILATLNRETSVFLVLAYLLIAWKRQEPRRIAGHLLAQIGLWLAIKVLLNRLFAHSPGSFTADMVHLNWLLLTRILHGNFTFIRLLPLAMGGTWILIPLAWRRQPVVFKRLLWIIPPFIAGMTIVGVLDEVRIYNELIPILLAPALFSLYVMFFSETDTAVPASAEAPDVPAQPVPSPNAGFL